MMVCECGAERPRLHGVEGFGVTGGFSSLGARVSLSLKLTKTNECKISNNILILCK